MKKIFTLLSFTGFLFLQASAQRLFTEDFNYAAGQLTDANSGANVSGGVWTSISGTGLYIPVNDGSLTYPNYVTAPTVDSRHIQLTSSSASAEDVTATFATQTSGTIYWSFLISVDSVGNLLADTSSKGEYFAALLPSTSTSSYVGRVVIRKGLTANTFNLGVAAQATTSTPAGWSPKDLVAGTAHLVTVGYQYVDGDSNDVTKIWVDAAVSSTEPSADAMSTFTVGKEAADINTIAFRQASTNTPSCKIDAIKVSTEWADATLPVKLVSFSGSVVNGHAALIWKTADETNMKEYVVERSSDAQNFTAITHIAAHNGISNNYAYTDVQALQGAAYYRVRMVDNDARASFSSAINLCAAALKALLLKENPVRNNLIIVHPQAGNESYVRIVAANGSVVLTQKLAQNATQSSLNVTMLKSGVYHAVFTNGSDKVSVSFVKQ